jgi:hypothetical protein
MIPIRRALVEGGRTMARRRLMPILWNAAIPAAIQSPSAEVRRNLNQLIHTMDDYFSRYFAIAEEETTSILFSAPCWDALYDIYLEHPVDLPFFLGLFLRDYQDKLVANCSRGGSCFIPQELNLKDWDILLKQKQDQQQIDQARLDAM